MPVTYDFAELDENIAMEDGTSSEAILETDTDPDEVSVHLGRSFKAYRWPIIASITVELAWCGFLTSWTVANTRELKNAKGDDELAWVHAGVAKDRLGVIPAVWALFAMCLAMRVLTVFGWTCHFGSMRDSTFAAAYMFFSSIQWVWYVMAYYLLYEVLTDVGSSPEVQVKSSSDTVADLIRANTTAGTGVFGMRMADCLEKYPPTICIGKVSTYMDCKMPFDPLLCSGWTWMGRGKWTTKCCIKRKYKLTRPSDNVPPTSYSMGAISSLLTVLSTLCIWWAIKDNPMLPQWDDASTFTNGVWLDVMDAVTFTQTYATAQVLLCPKFGIGEDGYAAFQDKSPWRGVMATCMVSFTAAVISPVLYTLFRRVNRQSDPGGAAGVDEAIAEITHRIRMLDTEAALRQVTVAVELQGAQYEREALEEEDGKIAVMVASADADADDAFSLGRNPDARPGSATRTHGGCYDVRYTDGQHPRGEQSVTVARVQPSLDDSHNACGDRCCAGWCRPSTLCARDAHERFERQANFWDAMRSLFLLELPFLLWRWHLEHKRLDMFSFAWVLMLKNVVWGTMDLLTVLGCGSTSSTCFGFAPVQFLSKTVNGTSLGGMMLMGEGGIVLIGHQLLQKAVGGRISSKLDRLRVHRAWLIAERHKATIEGDKEAESLYSQQIEAIEQLQAVLEKQQSMRVM